MAISLYFIIHKKITETWVIQKDRKKVGILSLLCGKSGFHSSCEFAYFALREPELGSLRGRFLICNIEVVFALCNSIHICLGLSWLQVLFLFVLNLFGCSGSWLQHRNSLSCGIWNLVPWPGMDGKESICNMGDLGSIPGLGRSPGRGYGNPLQYSCLENPLGQRSLAGYSPLSWRRVGHDWVTNHSTVAELRLGRAWGEIGLHCWVCGQLLVGDGEVGSKPQPGLEKAKEKCWKNQKVLRERGAGSDRAVMVSLEVQYRVLVVRYRTWRPPQKRAETRPGGSNRAEERLNTFGSGS